MGKGKGKGNGSNGGSGKNRRIIPGMSAEALLGDVARRVYSAALNKGRSQEQYPILADLAPLAEIGMNLGDKREAELLQTSNTLAMLFKLSKPAVDLLLFSLAAELDERIYLTAIHLTATAPGAPGPRVGGLLSLLYPDLDDRSEAHHALVDDAPLLRYSLVRLLGPKNTPVSQRELCAEPSLLPHILVNGLASPPSPAALAGVGAVVGPADIGPMDGDIPDNLGHRLDLLMADPGTVRALHLHLQSTKTAESIARLVAAHLRRSVVVLDVRAVGDNEEEKVGVALREARLRAGMPMFVNPMSMGENEDKGSVARENAQKWRRMLAGESNLVLLASEEPETPDVDTLASVGLDISSYKFPTLTVARRREIFDIAFERLRTEQPGGIPQIDVAGDISTEHLASVYRVSPSEIAAIVNQAAVYARLRNLNGDNDGEVTLDDVQRAARDKTHRDVGKFARLVESRYRWNDLVLPSYVKQELADIYVSAKKRAYVHEEWGYGEKHVRGLSLAVVFSGESGTGKTMAAEVLANELGVNLYQVDLAAVVSKWIGETERHLAQIFDATENSDCVLFFDEADALFGKRTEVTESKDRYANIEVSYLLQRIETYSGIVVLSTNLRSNMDAAFLRRLQFGVQFPMPTEVARREIWQRVFPSQTPLDDDVEFDNLANEWTDLSGGQIRLIAIGAAMMAAGQGVPVRMAHVHRAHQNELFKLNRVIVEGNGLADTAESAPPGTSH